MPYIPDDARVMVDQWRHAETSGELNYEITQAINYYIKNKKLSYQTINDILGALEGAKLEFYRRIAVPYEDMKMSVNGDVYTK